MIESIHEVIIDSPLKCTFRENGKKCENFATHRYVCKNNSVFKIYEFCTKHLAEFKKDEGLVEESLKEEKS